MKPLHDRFLKKINKTEKCWNWIGAKCQKGYGSIRHQYKTLSAHRVSWEIHNGTIPAGMHVLHKCDNPGCVNPEHLFIGTNQDNVDDKMNKGRYNRGDNRGEKAGGVKLTNKDILDIRRLRYYYGFTYRLLGEEFGVSDGAIRLIVKNINWSHIDTYPNL